MRKTAATLMVCACTVLLVEPSTSQADVSGEQGVSLSCSIQQRSNDFQTPSEVDVHIANNTDIAVAVRFDVSLVATNGAQESDRKQGKDIINARTGTDILILPFQDQQSVNGPAVLANTCTLSEIDVCPSYPPQGWPASAYYRPFLDGKGRCGRLANVGPIALAAVAPQCFAIRIAPTFTANGLEGVVYGWGASPNLNAAVQAAKAQASQAGSQDQEGTPGSIVDQLDRYYLHTSCDKQHGAIVGDPRGDGSGVTFNYFFDFEADSEAAKANALQQCEQKVSTLPDQSGEWGECNIAKVW
jgi:hypothetical protein